MAQEGKSVVVELLDEGLAAVGSHLLGGGFGAFGVGVPGNTDIHAVLGEGNRSRFTDAGVRSCDDGVSRIKVMRQIFPAPFLGKPPSRT